MAVASGSGVGGVAAHLAAAWLYQRSYGRLRGACVAAIAHVQRKGDEPSALVRAQELHRQFMRATRAVTTSFPDGQGRKPGGRHWHAACGRTLFVSGPSPPRRKGGGHAWRRRVG